MTISIRTDFPGGNGLLLDVKESAGGVEARFAAEPKNCPEAMWYHFRLCGTEGRAVRCILANPEQTLGGSDWSCNRPVFRRVHDPAFRQWRAGPWSRCGQAVKIETAGRAEWAWDIPAADGDPELAHCFPYQEADLAATLAELAGASDSPAAAETAAGRAGKMPAIRSPADAIAAGDPAGSAPPISSAFIGVSQKGRPMSRLYTALPDASRPAVVLAARNHAGETPGSWVLDGALRHLADRPELREALTWYAYPFVDLDDVVEGSYGKDPWPHDCNRSWGNLTRAETIAITADIRRLAPASARLFLVDLHAPAHQERTCYVPCRGWDADSPINPVAARFAEAFREAVPEELRSSIAHVTPGRGSLSRHAGLGACRWAGEVLGQAGVTLETSYQGNQTRHYSIEDYRRLGAALAETIAQWMRSA